MDKDTISAVNLPGFGAWILVLKQSSETVKKLHLRHRYLSMIYLSGLFTLTNIRKLYFFTVLRR